MSDLVVKKPLSPDLDQKETEIKKIKLDDEAKNIIHERNNILLSNLKFEKLISFNESFFVYEAKFNNERALVKIQNFSFCKDNITDFVNTSNHILEKIFSNDVYGSYYFTPDIKFTKFKSIIIYPANEEHFKKYESSKISLLEETYEDYINITLPYIEENKLLLNWIYNILDHKQETERIVLEDLDTETGFVFLPDLKWDGVNFEKIYLIAIVRKQNLKSIRDLNKSHLPLLKNIKEKCTKFLKEKYDIDSNELVIYFHYQPSYFHLHIHFTTLKVINSSSLYIFNLLDTVITNIEICDDYYQKAKLIFTIKESNPLFALFNKKKSII